jgi:hypothetical protein
MNDLRDKIWNSLVDYKFKSFLMSKAINRYQKYDRNMNICLAIASSGSIGAWAIWNLWPLLWGTIIAASEVINVIKPFFPYNKYIKILNSKNNKLDLLNIEYEKLFLDFDKGKISEDEAENSYFDLEKRAVNICNFEDDMDFKIKKEDEKRANKEMKIFLHIKYNIDIIID